MYWSREMVTDKAKRMPLLFLERIFLIEFLDLLWHFFLYSYLATSVTTLLYHNIEMFCPKINFAPSLRFAAINFWRLTLCRLSP